MTAADRAALVIGAGGLGGPVALRLAAEGVPITIIDDDRVDPTNLGRQVLFGDQDVGRLKAEAAAEAIRARYPRARVDAIADRLRADPAGHALITRHAVVVDGSDNFPTRFAANDLCVAREVPLVHGAAIRWQGQVLTILPGRTACLRCVFEGEPPARAVPTCAEAGVISPLVGVIGGWMAEAALAVLRDREPDSAGALRILDGLSGRMRRANVGRDPRCSTCGGM